MYKQDNKNYDINKIRKWSYRQRFADLAICSKEWEFKNAPYIDTFMLNQILFNDNCAVITKDENRKDKPYIVGKLTNVSDFDEYYRPTKWGMTTLNGKYSPTNLNETNSVIIYASPSRYGTSGINTIKESVYLFADRIALIDAVKRVNIQAQRTPYLVQPTPETGINLKHIIANLENCSDLVLNASSASLDDFVKVADLNAPWVADKLTDIEHDTYNQFYTFLGLNNSNVDKRERLITSEVDANNQIIKLYQYCTSKPLQIACDKINALWPDIECSVVATIDSFKTDVSNMGVENG